MDKFEAYSLLSGVVYVVWELFCVVVLFLIAPVFTMYTICLHCAYFLIFPVIFIFKTASYCGFVFIKYMPFFYLILKEFSLLLITIFLCYFKFLVVV